VIPIINLRFLSLILINLCWKIMSQVKSDVERKLKEKLSMEDFELALKLLSLSSSQIRDFIEEKVREIAEVE
ncbi:MAG: hypothetical protein QXW83_04720, partial [Nitrososphaerales archaeon]